MAAFYHARIYDPETGRFLQPDPVHTENAGMDNWDRYAYVNGNPVNFTDPSGMASEFIHGFNDLTGKMAHWSNKYTRGLVRGAKDFVGGARASWNSFAKGAFHSANHFTGGVAHSFNSYTGGLVRGAKDFAGGARASWNHWATGAIHGYDHFTGTNDFQAWVMYEMSGMTPEEFWLMWNIAHYLGGTGTRTWFGHTYTGDGNHDPFSGFNNEYQASEKSLLFWACMVHLRNNGNSDITDEQIFTFLMMIPLMSPGPKSFADGLAIGHDRQVPGNQKEGPQSAQLRADMKYIMGYYRGMLNPNSGFWDKPIDSLIVGGGGVFVLGVDAHIRVALMAFGVE